MPSAVPSPLVLIIDDDRDTRELYRIVLDVAGYRAAEAADVEEGVRVADLLRPHIVLCDWRLPDGDGLELARRVRALPAARKVPLVAVTGVSLRGDALRAARHAGFERVLLKPTLPEVILQTVEHVLENRRKISLRRAAITAARYAVRLRRRSPHPDWPLDVRLLVERVSARAGDDVALLVADDDAKYVAVNEQAARVTGFSRAELEAMTVWNLTPIPKVEDGRALWNSFIASGLQEGRYLLRRPDGSLVDASFCAVANVVPGLHVSVLLAGAAIPETVKV